MKCFHPIVLDITKQSWYKTEKPYDRSYPYPAYGKSHYTNSYDVHCISSNAGYQSHDYRTLPCGKCFACRVNRARDWSTRIALEANTHSKSCFVTLTYNDEHLPPSSTLVKRDVQLFMKRLRKRTKSKIRYFAVGEYGGQFGRPHYHIILFGIGYDSYKLVEESWTSGFIYMKNATVGIRAARYITSYCVKKQLFTYKQLAERNKEKEFQLQSLGIGRTYLTEKNITWHRENEARYIVFPNSNGVKVTLPRYIRTRIWSKGETERDRWTFVMEYIGMKAQEDYIESPYGLRSEDINLIYQSDRNPFWYKSYKERSDLESSAFYHWTLQHSHKFKLHTV